MEAEFIPNVVDGVDKLALGERLDKRISNALTTTNPWNIKMLILPYGCDFTASMNRYERRSLLRWNGVHCGRFLLKRKS